MGFNRPGVVVAAVMHCAVGDLVAQSATHREEVPVFVARSETSFDGIGLAQQQLGTGGVVRPFRPSRVVGATATTPGQVRIVAKPEGVRVRFPAVADRRARDLLVGTDGFVHLRDGGVGQPAGSGAVALQFADGTRLTVVPTVRTKARTRSRTPRRLQSVFVDFPDRPEPVALLWQQREIRVTDASDAGQRARRDRPGVVGTVWFVLGDGRSLYKPTPIGPLAVLERLVSPRDRDPRDVAMPRCAVMIAGDVLRDSLMRFPKLVGRQRVQFPRAPKVVARLVAGADELFPERLLARQPGGLGEMVVPIGGGFVVQVEVLDAAKVSGVVRIGLTKPGSTIPVVEWTCVPGRTRAHLVRPTDITNGGPRYFLRGIDVSDLAADVFGTTAQRPADLVRVRQLLRRLGARDPRAEDG